MNIRRDRKSLFLASTILRGRLLKSPDDDGIEVGAGFAAAADKMGGDDNRSAEARGGGATQEMPEGQEDDDQGNDDGDKSTPEGGQNPDDIPASGDEGGEEGAEAGDDDKVKTSKYVKDIKRDRRELRTKLTAEKARNDALEARLAALENGGSTKAGGGDSDTTTRAAPDPNDAAKYPLGVLDDQYIEDKIDWAAEQKVKAAVDGRSQTERAQAAAERDRQRAADLSEKVETLAERGAEQFDDFEEIVLEAGLRGDWDLTEQTFIAASKREHGHEILYNLATNRKEAKRVAQLPVDEQVSYVIEKNAEIAAGKPKARTKPRAEDAPNAAPRGRNSSSPIRADTDNLQDFKKLFYSTPAN